MPIDPLISVIMPAYDAEATIGAAISSVLTQSYPHVEVVVCSDGSTDRTDEIVAAYGGRVRLVRQDNAGPAPARNAAMAQARGDMFALLDSDDILLPDYLARAMQVWRNGGGGRRIVTSTAYFLTQEGIAPRRRVIHEVVPPERQRLRALESPFVSIFALFPRGLYDEIGPFDPTLWSAEDLDYWLRAIFRGYQVLFQMDPQALYRRTSGSLSAQVTTLAEWETKAYRKLLEDPGITLSVEERDRLEDRLRHEAPSLHIQRGEEALRAGDTAKAAEEFGHASRLLPSNKGLRRKALLLQAPFTGPALTKIQARRGSQT